jgi:AraC-like DNA-binding protein
MMKPPPRSDSVAVYPAVGRSPVEAVLLCERFERASGYRSTATSLPGHLLQLTCRGRAAHEVEGRQYDLETGDLIWYHEDEWVRLEVEDGPWVFLSVNFIAADLSPPPFEQRVRRVGTSVRERFEALLTAWRGDLDAPLRRHARVHANLMGLLAELADPVVRPFSVDPQSALWWEIETELRRDLSRPVSLSRMSKLSGRSVATIARSCQYAVQMPPMRRVKQIRMSLARGLLLRSKLRVGEVAQRVGYGRVHEFSRDFRKYFGVSPSESAGRRGGVGFELKRI